MKGKGPQKGINDKIPPGGLKGVRLPEGQELEFIKKLQKAEPSKTVMIFEDMSIGYAPGKYIPNSVPQFGNKDYEKYNPLWDD